MNKIKTVIMVLLMTPVLALSSPLVYADNANGGNITSSPAQEGDQDGGHGHWERHGDHHRVGFFKDLTDDQKKQLRGIWQGQKEAGKAAFKQIKANKDAIINELLQTTPDVTKINGFESKLHALDAQMLDDRIKTDLEVKKVLTAEQFAQYLEFQKRKCGHHHGHHHGHWGDNGDNRGQ